jgi:hypothetical protein
VHAGIARGGAGYHRSAARGIQCVLRLGDGQEGRRKKLTDAARYWAEGGASGRDELDADAAFFGIDAETAAEPAADFEVFEDNWLTVMTFLRCGTQWRHAGMEGIRTGLDYPSVETVLRMTVTARERRAVFEGIQIMEHAALDVFAQRAAARKH